MPNIKQNDDGSLGIQGTDEDDGAFIPVSSEYNASSVSKVFFVASRAMRVKDVRVRVEVKGTDSSAVTVEVAKVPDGTAVASGTALHSGTANLKGTDATEQVLTLSTTSSDLDLAAGDALGLIFAGTLTAATGVATVTLAPK